jgi:glycosyltransferase involved in cell wall biosynthesis
MKISVVVPSFNQAQYLEETLQSILSQEGPLEVFVQDGGSTDGSVEILKKYDGRIQWVSSRDGGQSAAINEGLKKATGEILCYLNSDDLWLPNTLSIVRRAFTEHPKVSFVYGLADFVDGNGNFLRGYPVERFDRKRLLETCPICQPACFWKKSVYEHRGEFDAALRFSMDYEYYLRCFSDGEQFQFIPEKLAMSRYHTGAKSSKDRVKVNLEALAVLEKYGRPSPTWMRGYARALADDSAEGFWQYAKIYMDGMREMAGRYKLGFTERAWIFWKLWGSWKLRNRMG